MALLLLVLRKLLHLCSKPNPYFFRWKKEILGNMGDKMQVKLMKPSNDAWLHLLQFKLCNIYLNIFIIS